MSRQTPPVESLLLDIAEIWRADEALAAYAMDINTRPPLILIGVDESNPPGADDYPLLVLSSLEIDHGDSKSTVQYAVDMAAAVHDPTVTPLDDDRIILHRGLISAATLMERAIEAIVRARRWKTDYLSSIGAVSYHPEYVAFCTIQITQFYGAKRRGGTE